ncbi:hypothetical protein [Streptomyces sp. SID8352]|uniref:hypothetical protein n=1 Tax=Streptomyces sp. SID8352 TaxID=2690338 RepID=UPI00136E5A8F|nr:hypothetical protein [Streptomyces sp. SID8352]MYU23523.1 hypothetical protein [Streptomyces sp. SID8352]
MTTQHTHGPTFGRRVDGCPRCDELDAGAAPVRWSTSRAREDERRRSAEIRAHDCRAAGCAVVCTYGDW